MQLIYRVFFLFTWLLAVSGYLQASVYEENQVKAAFLYNFPKFIELPGENTLTLCIVGEDSFGDSVNEIPSCQILFLSSLEKNKLEPIMRYARNKPILTVGDTPEYSNQGVIINFYLENNRVKIEINMDAAEQSKLKISSKLLNLARIIRDKQ